LSYYGFLPFEINILRSTKIPRERYTIKVRTDFAVVDRYDVEQENETAEQEPSRQQAHPYQRYFLASLVHPERNERQQRVRQQKSEHETEQMSIIVDPGQETDQEEG
jgi:hypothetical protein